MSQKEEGGDAKHVYFFFFYSAFGAYSYPGQGRVWLHNNPVSGFSDEGLVPYAIMNPATFAIVVLVSFRSLSILVKDVLPHVP